MTDINCNIEEFLLLGTYKYYKRSDLNYFKMWSLSYFKSATFSTSEYLPFIHLNIKLVLQFGKI